MWGKLWCWRCYYYYSYPHYCSAYAHTHHYYAYSDIHYYYVCILQFGERLKMHVKALETHQKNAYRRYASGTCEYMWLFLLRISNLVILVNHIWNSVKLDFHPKLGDKIYIPWTLRGIWINNRSSFYCHCPSRPCYLHTLPLMITFSGM